MGISEERRHPLNTQEFLAMWSAAKEEHFAQELAPVLPVLLGSPENLDPARVGEAARQLVRAMYLASAPEGGLHAAVEYLAQVTAVTREPSASS
ncbi:MAG TPA: hypothetical protein VFZ87_10310 [Gemmatimonadales bacterium]